MLALISLSCGAMTLLILLHRISHLVAQTARFGRYQVIQRLDPLLFNQVQVSLLLLEGAQDRVLSLGCGRLLLFIDKRNHHIIVWGERRDFRVDNETVWLAISLVTECLLVVPRIDSFKMSRVNLVLFDHLNFASMRF